VRNLIAELYGNHHGGWLTPLYEAIFASHLMYLDEFMNEYGASHLIVKRFIGTANDFHLDFDTLLKWGELVKIDWKKRNFEEELTKEAPESLFIRE
jgi:hypothetical protein